MVNLTFLFVSRIKNYNCYQKVYNLLIQFKAFKRSYSGGKPSLNGMKNDFFPALFFRYYILRTSQNDANQRSHILVSTSEEKSFERKIEMLDLPMLLETPEENHIPPAKVSTPMIIANKSVPKESESMSITQKKHSQRMVYCRLIQYNRS